MIKFRYEVLAWDGFACWSTFGRVTKTRRITRIIRDNHKQAYEELSQWDFVSHSDEAKIGRRKKWKVVKIWDRKNKKFVY